MSTPVEQIKDRLSILDVVGSYVKLAKAGKHYKGRSPFTNEKTPSFFVSPERGMYYCFSSGKGGDMFTFISEMEGVDFRGALKMLAERAGVSLVEESPETRGERDQLYAVMEDATRFFEQCLENESAARAYLTNRGVTDETRKKWRIGFAPSEWRALRDHLRQKGYDDHMLLGAGLIKGSEKSAEPYDVFRNRIMFPIADTSGRVVGFSGRDQSGDKEAPKYVNSPETQLFQKSKVLFGYDKAKQGIRQFDFSLIVEGQFDLVLSHQAGYTNAVAISGTALTQDHVELLRRLSNRVVLALDSDRAGVASAKRAATLMLARDMDVKVARIEGGKDPADLVREDPKLLKNTIGGARHVIPALISMMKSEQLDPRTFRLRVRDEVLPFIALMPNRIDAEFFEELVSKETETTKDTIHFEVERLRTEGGREVIDHTRVGEAKPQPEAPITRRSEDVATHLFGVLLWQKSLTEPSLSISKLQAHIERILGKEAVERFLESEPAGLSKAIFIAEAAYGEEERLKQLHTEISFLLLELKRRTIKKGLLLLREKLKTAEREGDTEMSKTLVIELQALQKELVELEEKNPFTDIA